MHQELYNRGIKKPISKDQEESTLFDWSIEEDLNEVLDITHNLADIYNDIQAPDLSEFDFGKNIVGHIIKLRLVINNI